MASTSITSMSSQPSSISLFEEENYDFLVHKNENIIYASRYLGFG